MLKKHRNSIKITVDLCEARTIEMLLRFWRLHLNTRYNHFTTLLCRFQCLSQCHLNFRAVDEYHLDFLF